MSATTMPAPRLRPAAHQLLCLLATALVVSACQSGAPIGGDDQAGSEPDAPAAEAADPSDDRIPEHSPLAAVMGEAEVAAEGTFRAQFTAVEELVVACMAQAGFTYEPRTLPTKDESEPTDLPPHEFAAQFGFGFTTLEDGAGSDEMPEDPNAAALAEMSDAERAAWDAALWGTTAERGADGAPEQSGGEGCFDAATTEVHGTAAYDAEAAEAFEPLLEEIGSLHDQVQRDPRVVESREAYGSCMADAGHPGHSLDGEDGPTAQEAVRQRLEAIAGQSPTGDAGTDEASGRSIGGVDLADLDPDALAEVRAFEIELAVADEACRRDHEELHRQVMFEYEEEFVESHRAELEAYREAVYGAGGQR